MGVHTTFVRSVDLDEWTQRQIDSMKLGGNANAATYLRKHGMTNTHTKIEKKFLSKAAQSYRTVLTKLIDAEAVKRGEMVAADESDSAAVVLDTIEASQDAAKTQRQPVHAVSKAVKASEMSGAKGKLVTPPSSGNMLKLRKPASSSAASMNLLKKKPMGAKSSGMRFNKLAMKKTTTSEEGLEDIETTMKATADAETAQAAAVAAQAKQFEAEALADKLAAVASIGNGANGAVLSPKRSPIAVTKQSMADGVARLKADNMDFFGGV